MATHAEGQSRTKVSVQSNSRLKIPFGGGLLGLAARPPAERSSAATWLCVVGRVGRRAFRLASGGQTGRVRPEPERDPGGAEYWSRSDSLKKLLPRTRGAGQRRREQGP